MENLPQMTACLPEYYFAPSLGHEHNMVLNGTCSPIWNGIGFGKALTSKSSFQVKVLIKPLEEDFIPERSNLFESHWSNQWLTQNRVMNTDTTRDPFVRRYLALATKNLRRCPVRTGLTVAGVALAVTVAVSLGGFMLGYRGAIDKSIDMLGFQVMIMAKGCPYEAATMMLKGGTGLLYLPGDIYQKVRNDPDIESITPIFIGVAQKQESSIRDEGSASNFTIVSGIDVPTYLVMKPWLAFKKGPGATR